MREEAYGKVDALNEDDVQTQEGHSTERAYTGFHVRSKNEVGENTQKSINNLCFCVSKYEKRASL